jgi:dTDP-4-dehydrorhamnose 3,5-epimerase
MEVEKFEIDGLLLLKPRVFEDDRGYFLESFNQDTFAKATGLDISFVQDNESKSNKGVLRGLHFQIPPYEQGKLVRVVSGRVLDVAVDIRKSSPTFGQYQMVELSSQNKHQFFVPPGFAHGFAVLEDNTIFCYKCTGRYNHESERALRWNDDEININWGLTNPILSEKDEKNSLTWNQLNSPF